MKTRIFVAALFVLAVLAYSCHKKNDVVNTSMLKTDSTKLSAIKLTVGSIDSFMITSNTNWTVTIKPATAYWLTVSPASGNGNAKIYVRVVQSNTGATTPTASIEVTSSDVAVQPVTIPVTQQAAAPSLQTDSTRLSAIKPNAGAIDSFNITSNANWTITVPTTATWLTVTPVSGSGNTKVYVNVVQNNATPATRAASIVVNSSDATVQPVAIPVTQKQFNPHLVWSKLVGGSGDEAIKSVIRTSDGGYAGVGYTSSNDGDVTNNNGFFDLFVVKVDAVGALVWKKALGGSSDDLCSAIAATADGGFVVVGYTFSNNGDVSGFHGNCDVWVVKLNSTGDMVWQKALGGIDYERANAIVASPDGGFVVAGLTTSNDGDVSGNHGATDMWIVKLNSTGNLVWQKALGGTDIDAANAIVATADGGFVLTGYTRSNDGDVSGNHGNYDMVIVKLDRNGTMIWGKEFGGTGVDEGNAIVASPGGGYAITVSTNSNNNDVTGNHGDYDMWIVKVDDNGGKLWSTALGGDHEERGWSIAATPDGGYAVAGHATSTNGDVIGNHGNNFDAWVVKLDGAGQKLWAKPFGGIARDQGLSIVITADGGYAVAGNTTSNDGDVSGNHGSNDGWLFKISDQ